MKGVPQNVLLNFRLEFPKNDLTIYLPTGISEIFFQMVSTPGVPVRCPTTQALLRPGRTQIVLDEVQSENVLHAFVST